MEKIPSQIAFEARDDLRKYGSDALALFALQLRFSIEDIQTIAYDSIITEWNSSKSIALTDKITGGDDKKCDLVFIDRDNGTVVVIQSEIYEHSNKLTAKKNKASDLHTAASYIFNNSIESIPDGLKQVVQEIRELLNNDEIELIQFWFVHNRPESEIIKDELTSVTNSVLASVKANYKNSSVINIASLEVGKNTVDAWYHSLENSILVSDEFSLTISEGFSIKAGEWEAFVTCIPIAWLHEQFQTYKDNLFSANVRGYLGRTKNHKNINNGIRLTALENPENFWVFNNGITVLVHDFKEIQDDSTSLKKLIINGLSIVNGAQTTGAIGNLDNEPEETGFVQIRFIKCPSKDTVKKIIEFNNRQNEIEPSDYRSNDHIQKRLRQEFESIPNTTYYGRRGGSEDIIRRPNRGTNIFLSLDTVAQSLASFHQDPVIAYNNKADIWLKDELYSRYFCDLTSAKHILFAFSLLRAVENKKDALKNKKVLAPLIGIEEEQLSFLTKRGSHFLLVAAIAKCLEILLEESLSNYFCLSFIDLDPQISIANWESIVDATIPFCNMLSNAVSNSLSQAESAKSSIDAFQRMIASTFHGNQHTYKEFKKCIEISR
ncbi:AIPR family protein [Synechocystis sp. PCC 7339]|uniref:AIPR family protein n=1 Tax=Synechocystis sp. PCC 7339 TaxID=2782213 RepID=UPI001CC0025A|nr:AIPR family protein [Synechocystis sp. PCC 7339]UAJ73016.1 AIPR family protein [Synechocystis sp. PCC 7339]